MLALAGVSLLLMAIVVYFQSDGDLDATALRRPGVLAAVLSALAVLAAVLKVYLSA